MGPVKVLLVDDEEKFVIGTQKLLSHRGFDVFTAANGLDALDILEKEDVHVVLMDVKMPKMDGITALKEVRRRFPLVEVILLTGHATFESAVTGIKIGASDYLMKPADLSELLQKIAEAVEKRKMHEEKIRHDQRHEPK